MHGIHKAYLQITMLLLLIIHLISRDKHGCSLLTGKQSDIMLNWISKLFVRLIKKLKKRPVSTQPLWPGSTAHNFWKAIYVRVRHLFYYYDLWIAANPMKREKVDGKKKQKNYHLQRPCFNERQQWDLHTGVCGINNAEGLLYLRGIFIAEYLGK